MRLRATGRGASLHGRRRGSVPTARGVAFSHSQARSHYRTAISCDAQDTFYVGTLKGVGRIYQQTFIDTYSKVGFAKLYDRKRPVTAADLLNDRVVPFFEQHEIPVNRVITDRGTEYCADLYR